MSSHSLSLKLLEYGISVYFNLGAKIPNGFFKFSREEILSTLEMMLQSPAFEFENRSVVYQALQRAKQGKADFSDYLIGAIATHASCQETVTFDRKLKGERGFRCFTQD